MDRHKASSSNDLTAIARAKAAISVSNLTESVSNTNRAPTLRGFIYDRQTESSMVGKIRSTSQLSKPPLP